MPHPPLYGDRWGIGGDLTHRMCQIPHPSITIQCQIPTLYIHMRICAGTRANACAGQKPHPWGVISWRIPYQAPPLSPTGGVGRNIDRRIISPFHHLLLTFHLLYFSLHFDLPNVKEKGGGMQMLRRLVEVCLQLLLRLALIAP